MPGRLVPLLNGEIYHVYNRGCEKREIFLQPRDFKRFQPTFYYYQYLGPKISFSKLPKKKLNSFQPTPESKLVEIISFVLMPNHFHFIVKQLKENGISIFLSQLSNSYTKYFNKKINRVGPLFQGVFKSVLVESNEQLIHLSRYIHLNPVVSGLSPNLKTYKWSSYHEYIGQPVLCLTQPVLESFSSQQKYIEFLEDHIDYATSLEQIKHQVIDEKYGYI